MESQNMSATNYNNSSSIKLIAVSVAVVAILLYVGADIFLFMKLDVLKEQWDKAIFLYKGLEAIALAGAGFLFGREVHRERAESAEKRADRNEEGVKNGQKLAGAIKVSAQQAHIAGIAAAGATPQTGLAALEKLADKLFP